MQSLSEQVSLSFRDFSRRLRSWATRVGSRRLEPLVQKVVRFGRLTAEFVVGFIGHDIGPRPLVIAGVIAAVVGILVIRRRHGS